MADFPCGATVVGHKAIFQYCQTATGMDHYQAIFLLGWITRMAAVPILILLVAAPGKELLKS